MAKLAQLSVTAENQYSDKFKIAAGAALISLTVEDSSSISIIRYDIEDGTTVVGSTKITESQVMTNPSKGLYKIGCATGDFVSACVVTVEQD